MVDSLSRRELLSGLAASGVVSAIHPESNAGLAAPDAEEPQEPYDLLICGGKVVDPSQNIEALQDAAIRAGKIVRLEPNIPATSALQVLSVQENIVAPGLIDLHTHVCPYGVAPDPFCVTRGVTTVVDADSAGAFGFPAFRRFIETDGRATRIFALLNLSAIGNGSGPIPNMGSWKSCGSSTRSWLSRLRRQTTRLQRCAGGRSFIRSTRLVKPRTRPSLVFVGSELP
jgi:dihydroorotase